MTRLSLPAVTLAAMHEVTVHPPGAALRNLTISGGPPWGIQQVLAPNKVRAREVHVFWSNVPDLPALEWLSGMPGLRVVQLHGERSNLPFPGTNAGDHAQPASASAIAGLRNVESRWVKLTWWPPNEDESVDRNMVWDELLKFPPIPGGVSHVQVSVALPASDATIAASSPRADQPLAAAPISGRLASVSECISLGHLTASYMSDACWSSLVDAPHRAHVRLSV
ncbi:hypothetical protein BCR44DRAFT_1436021, partial [Catenaria anguillulae PL171]